MGRPSVYRVEYATIGYRMTLLGATDKDMAEAFGVSEQTINGWKSKHPKFFESIKSGKIFADSQVAESLFRRANGITRKAVKIFQHEGQSYEHEYEEYFPPDTGAAMAWLKNRRPAQWRDKPADLTVNVNNDVKVDLTKPPEEWGLAEIEAELAKRGALSAINGNGNGNGAAKPKETAKR